MPRYDTRHTTPIQPPQVRQAPRGFDRGRRRWQLWLQLVRVIVDASHAVSCPGNQSAPTVRRQDRCGSRILLGVSSILLV